MQISAARRLIARVFLPFAAGYYLSYLFRTINALIASHLSSEIGLGTADLGLLTSVYFLVFAAAQIPVGILLDRFGRRTVSADRIARPASPYIVQAGTVIPGALITGTRSDLPGQITAQVTENVYDTPTGRFLLVPHARIRWWFLAAIERGKCVAKHSWTRRGQKANGALYFSFIRKLHQVCRVESIELIDLHVSAGVNVPVQPSFEDPIAELVHCNESFKKLPITAFRNQLNHDRLQHELTANKMQS